MLTDPNTWHVTVITGRNVDIYPFKDERKARDCYADCLLRYPKSNVELVPPPQ